MRREVMWSAWDVPGLGHLRLAVHDDGITADGVVIGVTEGRPFRVVYEVRCDAEWRVRALRVVAPGEPPGVDVFSDGEGNWTTLAGRAVPELQGCIDADISVTPFTNTLPIRRLDLAPEESAELCVAYVKGTELQAWPEPQRYICLEKSESGRTLQVPEPRRRVHRRPAGGRRRLSAGLPGPVPEGTALAENVRVSANSARLR